MSRLTRSISILLVLALVFGAGYFVGRQPSTTPAQAQNEDLNELFVPFWESWDALNQRYVDPLDPEMLMIGAIRGMVESIGDPHMEYMDADQLQNWNLGLTGAFEGIGATVRQDEGVGGLTIVRPLDGSPAEAAGLLPGDRIVQVNGDDVTELSQTEIIDLVRGPAGTPVRLGIDRAGEAELMEFTVVRAVIDMPTLEYDTLDNEIGYIQIARFTEDVPQELQAALTALDANNLEGLVIDLRGNPGGFLEPSLQVISQFVNEGPILIEQFPGNVEEVREAYGNAIAPDVPIAILVDEGSASASELVAGALRDRDRAVIVGMPTFGKNVVQTVTQISNGGAIRISIARWLTPDGISVQPDGLMPDVQIEYDPESDPEFDNQLAAAVRALKGIKRDQASAPAAFGYF